MRTVAGTRPLPRKKHARNNPEKWCPRCESWKPRDEEHFYRTKAGAWQGYCRSCHTFDTKYSFASGRKLRELKDNQPCMDCGQVFRFFQLDYDHRPGEEKIMPVARMASKNWAWDRLLAEIAKCDLVCANCHRMRTWLRASATS